MIDGKSSGLIGANILDLQQWKDGWDKEYKQRLRIFYRFSLQYESLWESMWSLYDDLEAARIADSASRLPWQARIEEYRATISKARIQLFKAVKPKHWALYPLSIHYDGFCNIQDQDRQFHWKATLDNWLNFQGLYNTSEEHPELGSCPSFRASLSLRQQSSYEVLKDWWAASYCSKDLLEAVRSFLALNRQSQYPFPDMHSPKIIKSIKAEHSYYHQMCFALFILEFNPRSWEPNSSWTSLGMLSKSRFYASCLATAQCMSYNNCLPHEAQLPRRYPNVVPFTDLPTKHQLSNEKPRWLWDVKSQETIAVSGLSFCPTYACISHTWGRWKKATSINVPGVRGWLVPENHLYDVQELPHILNCLPFKYIWLDLFCIPQDGSISAAEEIARQTTIFKGSEACIAWLHDVNSWEGMEYALKWLCLQYLNIADKTASSNWDSDEALQQAALNAESPLSLMHLKSGSSTLQSDPLSWSHSSSRILNQWEPSTWFSSLWTLQEAVLCPRMELYSKNWRRLEDQSGAAVTLVSLGAFLHIALKNGAGNHRIFDLDNDPMNPIGFQDGTNWGINIREDSMPTAVRHLYDFLEMTRLNNVLLNASPVSIIFNANIRRCTRSRAPAIMSAVGVTDWYSTRLRDRGEYQSQNENLVLGIYPLDFVREAFQRFGACFFEATFIAPRKRLNYNLKGKRPTGSMLPFTKAKGWLFGRFGPPELGRIDVSDHPAVAEWVILENGTVLIQSAGVMTSSEQAYFPKTSGSLLCFEVHTNVEDGATDDFHQKLKELFGGQIVHAVALYQDGLVQTGILLCQQDETCEDGQPIYLVKVGVYWINGQTVRPDLPDTTSVDWIVL